jgi:aminopeptidase N
VVAGNLVAREQRITTRSGSDHLLQVWVRPATWTRPSTP